MVTEQTQFSMSELEEFRKVGADPSGAGCNKREKAMLAFLSAEANKVIDFSKVGYIGNIQRVRVLADLKDPSLPVRYEFVTKLPVAALAEQGRREKEAAKREERENALMVYKVLLLTDPKKAEYFLKTEAYKLFDRLFIIELLETAKALQKPAKAPRPVRAAKPRPKPVRKPAAKQDAYALALEQDRLNRIKASKEAAAALRKKAS